MSPTPKVTAASSLMKWLLAIVMTAIVTRMLLFPAGVFQSKVPSEADAEKVRFAEKLNPHQPVQRPIIPPRGDYGEQWSAFGTCGTAGTRRLDCHNSCSGSHRYRTRPAVRHLLTTSSSGRWLWGRLVMATRTCEFQSVRKFCEDRSPFIVVQTGHAVPPRRHH